MDMDLTQADRKKKHYKRCYKKIYRHSAIYLACLALFFVLVSGLKGENLTELGNFLYASSLVCIGCYALFTMYKLNRYFKLIRF